MAQLVVPHAGVHASFVAAMAEFRAEGRGGRRDDTVLGSEIREIATVWVSAGGFSVYLEGIRQQADPTAPRPVGWVPASTWWWTSGTEFLGRIQVRHELTDHLLQVGGHIGYDVRPSARGRGHGTAMLAAVLPRVRELGIDPALITCDVDNVASQRVIERNGGRLEDERHGKLRYWVATTPS